jgi:arylsulfatase A-like enzyme
MPLLPHTVAIERPTARLPGQINMSLCRAANVRLTLCLFSLTFCTFSLAHPNVLFIVADDLGWNDVGYHNAEMRTPRIDSLLRSGVELDCHYVQPQCTPTRVALMTGRYPSRFGLHCCQASNAQSFPIGTLTIANMLKEAGYDTGMSGKWHMGSKPEWGPNHHGFDYSHGSMAGAVGMYDHRYRLNTPFAITWHRNHEMIEEEGHVTDLTTNETVKWIESHAKSEKPWFFFVPFHAVHTPLVERDERWTEMNKQIESEDRRLYAAAVSHMDHSIGLMVDALDRTGQRSDTLVIFTSDNGAQVNHGGGAYPPPDPKLTQFSSNKPLRGEKTQTYEGGYRVPAFVNWQGKLAPKKLSDPLHVVDWMTTLASLVSFEQTNKNDWDGQDVWPLITGEQIEAEDRTIYIVWGAKRNREALRHGDWKIVRNGGQEWELYHLAADPYETNDLKKASPDQYDELQRLYQLERLKDAVEESSPAQ